MLILTRRLGETIRIGEDVSVSVMGVRGNEVRIGIAAPMSIPVHREEVYERIANHRTRGVAGGRYPIGNSRSAVTHLEPKKG